MRDKRWALQVQPNLRLLTGGTQVTDHIYRNESLKYTYTLAGSGESQSLFIQKDGSQNKIIIRNWTTAKNLNITLDDTQAPPSYATLSGDFEKYEFLNPNYPDYRVETFEWVDPGLDYRGQTLGGNYHNYGAQTNTKDLLQGTGSANNIYGYGNDDALSGQGGDDYLNGGSGKIINLKLASNNNEWRLTA